MFFGLLSFAFFLAGTVGRQVIDETASQASHQETPFTDAADILPRMMAYARWRTESLPAYTSIRKYHVEYQGIVKKNAEMAVRMICAANGEKRFEITSEAGSRLLRERVLRRLLENEVDAARIGRRPESAITPDNYQFRLLPVDTATSRDCYVLETIPRRKAKFLFVGKIWVDRKDFAIVRIEGEPAVNPSWWIKGTKILHTYKKFGRFWLYDSNESTTRVRLGGRAFLTIRYEDYDWSTPDAVSRNSG